MPKVKNTFAKAIEYTERGWSVIPVGLDKRPKINWKEYQKRQPTFAELEKWFFDNDKNNIAIVTGAISGITVVDLDVHKGADFGNLPQDTFIVKTGNGGYHLYYQYHPNIQTGADVLDSLPGVDIRNDGGYVVAPPSVITPKYEGEDGVYEVREYNELLEFPAAMFKTRKSRTKLDTLVGVPKKSRNDSMTKLIGSLVSTYPQSRWDEVWSIVERVNQTYKPPLPKKELETIWQSIATKQKESGDMIESPLVTPEEVIGVKLRRSKSGVTYKDMVNAVMALQQHPKYTNSLRYNTFRHEIEYNGRPLMEEDVYEIQHYMQADVDLPNISKTTVYEAIQRHSFNNKYDEALDWLDSLEWDGEKRLEHWIPEATGVEDNQYHRAIGAHWMLGMVKRLVYPGCVFDHVLCATGPQGVGKTSLFRIIGGDWYKSHTESADNKDFFLKLRGACLIDLDEGATMFRTESIKLKSVITEVCDEYRAPYDKTTQKYPRRFVFSMSTNDIQPFKDQTGNRRYWVLNLEDKIDFAWLQDNRDQIFAEAYYVLQNNVKIEEVPFEEALRLQEEAMVKDEWINPIVDWMSSHVDYLQGSDEFSVTVTELYQHALKGDAAYRLDRYTEMRIGNILRNELHFRRERIMIDGERKYRYFMVKKERERMAAEYAKDPKGMSKLAMTKKQQLSDDNF